MKTDITHKGDVLTDSDGLHIACTCDHEAIALAVNSHDKLVEMLAVMMVYAGRYAAMQGPCTIPANQGAAEKQILNAKALLKAIGEGDE